MVRAAERLRPDLVIAHCEAALWAGKILHLKGFRVAVDFEDWFSQDLLPEHRRNRPVKSLQELERWHLHRAAYCTAPTRVMAAALADDAGTPRIPAVIPNAFPWRDRERAMTLNGDGRGSECSFYWYSQTIGPGRGLEPLGAALLRVKGNWRLRLRGVMRGGNAWFDRAFPLPVRQRLEVLDPVPNEALLARHGSHDVGLALEIPYVPNKNLTASNKLFDYLRAGLAIVATDTAGQTEVLEQAPGAAWMVPSGDVGALAAALQEAVDDPDGLRRRKRSALDAARAALAWEAFADRLKGLVADATAARACPG
jgi:glycosyltransferase involved in cell wall biosynthesis